MIKEVVEQWDKNKHKIEEYFKTTRQEEYCSYEKIVIKLFELCINKASDYNKWDYSSITVIDDGDYQGTQMFIIPSNVYQPSIDDYLITHTYYGSCSGCDTLESIRNYSDDLPTEHQLKEYMTLALHLVQKIRRL